MGPLPLSQPVFKGEGLEDETRLWVRDGLLTHRVWDMQEKHAVLIIINITELL